ncbi:MAG TPA: hypothetical protein VGE00_10590, partial [Gammaproteobacteria bacterium]
DSDASTFFHYLSLAAHHATPRKKGALPQFSDTTGVDPLRFAAHYFAQFNQRLRPGQLLVLDDYHLVDGEPRFNELIVALAQSLPPGRTLLVASRREPPRAFSRLLLNQALVVVREEALRFTQEEVAAVAGKLDQAGCEQLHRLTEGWPAGVMLLAHQPLPVSAEVVQAGVLFDYFAQELFNRFNETRQRLLLTTCFLEDIAPQQAALLSGVADSTAQLRALVAENLFTQAIGPHHYRYHILFRYFLQIKARKRFATAQLSQLRHTSAQLLEQSGYFDEAVTLYGEAEEWAEAVRLAVAVAPRLFGEGRSRTLAMIIARLPDGLVQQEPWLLHWRGVVRLASDADAALVDLAEAFELFLARGAREAACWSWIAAVQFQAYNWRSANKLIEWLERRYAQLELSADEPASFEQRFRITALMALGHYQSQYRTEANAGWLTRLERMIDECSDATLREEGIVAAFFIYFITGESDKIRRLLELSNLEAVNYEQNPLLYMMLMITYPMTLIFMGRFEESRRYIAKAEQVVEEYGITSLLDTVLTVKIYTALIGRDYETVRQALEQVKGLAKRGGEFAKLNHANLSDYYYRDIGKYELACRYGEEAVALTQAMNYRGYGIFVRVDLLHSLLENGEEARYLELYPALFADTEQSGYHTKRVHLRLTEAQRLLRHGDRQGWFNLMEEALQIAAQFRICLFAGWPRNYFSRLMLFALQHDICSDYARTYIEENRTLLDAPPPYELHWSWPVRIHTLGRFELQFDGLAVERLENKSQALLKMLVVHGRLGRAAILEALYPDQPESKALNAYYVCLHRLRKVLGGEQAVLTTGQALELNPDWCWIDATAFEAFLRSDTSEESAARNQLLAIYRGEYLPQQDDDEVIARRERLRGAFVRLVLEELKVRRASDAQDAIALCLQALEAEPASEVLYQQLI